MARPHLGTMRAAWLTVLVATLAAAPSAHGADETVVRGDLGAALDAAVLRATAGSFWGGVLVARGGEVLLAKGYGMADYAERPNAPDTLHEIASTSKQVTAAAILKLVMKRKLRLEDPLSRVLRKVPADKSTITIHHLLTHTSGIAPGTGVPYASRMSRTEFIRYVLGEPLTSAPGERFAYSNCAYALLAAIVEEVANKPFERFVRDELFRKAGLRDTGFIGESSLDAARASRREDPTFLGASAVRWHWSWGYRGMGGVVSTIADLYRWDRALRGDAVLDARAKEAYYTPNLEGYALGWRVETTPRGTRKVHHSGGVRGYAVQYARWLEDDAVVVILSNGKSDLFAVERALTDLLFPAPTLRARLEWAGYEPNRSQVLHFERGLRLAAARTEGGARLTMRGPGEGGLLATLDLPAGLAAQLRDQLAAFLRGRPETREDTRGCSGGLYLQGQDLSRGVVELSEGIALRAIARYSDVGAPGDDRITLMLMSADRRHSPLMTQIDDATARALLAALGG